MTRLQTLVFTLTVLLVLIAGTGIWLGEVDKVVRTGGEVVTTSPKIVLQPLSRAIIKDIYVHQGEIVTGGTPLISLDPTFVDADIESLQTKLASLEAELARLQAELDDWVYPLPEATLSPHDQIQRELLSTRHRNYEEELRKYDSQLKLLDSESRKETDLLGGLRQRLVVSEEIEGMYRDLVKNKGSGSQLEYLKSKAERLRIQEQIGESENNLKSLREKYEGTLNERSLFVSGWRNEVYQRFVEQRRERDAILQELSKSQKEKQMVLLKAPMDAQVIQIEDISPGSVVREATTLMSLIPLDSSLEVEVKISIRDISFLAIGMPVVIKLDSLPYQKYGYYAGELVSLNRSTIFEEGAEGNKIPVFLARIQIRDNQTRNVPETFRLVPGMTVVAEIRVGERPLYEYILYPILRGIDESVREPY